MMPHPILVERLCNERIDRLMAEANHLRQLREARAGRRQPAPNPVGSLRVQGALGGIQAVLAAMTRLWSVATR